MRRHTFAFCASLGTFFALSMAAAEAREVRVYNWSDYIDEAILEKFEAETGIEVTYDVFDSNELLETRLLTGQTGYDIVVPTGTFLARQIQAGVFQELDKDKLPNLSNMWGDIEERMAVYDPENAFSINYMWGTTGIGVNVDMVQERLGADFDYNTWDLVFDPQVAAQLQDCGIFWLDAPTEMVPAALNYLGLDPRSTDPGEIEQARDLMMGARETVQKFHNSENINALANGDICVAVGWSGDMLIARDRAADAKNGVNVEYLIPGEGALMWFDQMAIPADAPNVEEAHEFLNFIMDPENIAAASNYVYYANGNEASKPLLNEDVIGDTAIYPDEDTVARLYTILPYDPRTQRVVTRAWTTVKTGQ
ncbi:MAG: polyamine ABC transporter substrate-binding protein [Pseudomonadota bacterium]